MINERGSLMKKLNIDEIHEVTLDLMDILHEICEKNGIKYYIVYGTLIGAVRHHGFIPWDDDFDICMTRDDYEKFIDIVNKMNDARYKIASRANTTNYYNGIARFYDANYEYRTKLNVLQYEQGVFIDIYPLDPCADTVAETQKIYNSVKKLDARYIIYCTKKSLSNSLKNIIRVPYHYFLRFRYGKSFPQKIDEMIKQKIYKKLSSNSKYVAFYWENRKDFRMFERAWFNERILVDFENRKYWIPKEYDRMLRLSYGDYMILPPENERVATHNYEIYRK